MGTRTWAATSGSSGCKKLLEITSAEAADTPITIPEKRLTKKVMRSSGPGGQSVNMSDSKVELSFNFSEAEWLPELVKEKMKVMFKRRVSKTGGFAVKCQVTSSQIENTKLAVQMIQESIEE